MSWDSAQGTPPAISSLASVYVVSSLALPVVCSSLDPVVACACILHLSPILHYFVGLFVFFMIVINKVQSWAFLIGTGGYVMGNPCLFLFFLFLGAF